MENKLKEILRNEQSEIKLRYDIKVRIELLAKLAGIKFDHVHHPERYSQKILEKDLKVLKKCDLVKKISFKL
jgi:hypothetical protein